MKLHFFFLLQLALIAQNVTSQCASSSVIGSSSNLNTIVENAVNPIVADKELNVIAFIHRNNAGVFGGHSGQLRYDFSTDGGTNWSINQGVLNPLSVNGTNGAKFPNLIIHNDSGNSDPNEAFIAYLATTGATSTTNNGYVSGVRKLNGTGNTETYNQGGVTQTFVPKSLVKGAPGEFWAADKIFNGSIVTGFRVFKGVWNGTNDVVWSLNFTATPVFETSWDGTPYTSDYNVAFDPSGTIGWMSFLGHISGTTNYSYQPVFYKTVDGGNNWSGPFLVNLNQFSCLTAILQPGSVLTAGVEHDLTVDKFGNPHLFTTVCNGNDGYGMFYNLEHRMYDITQINGVWNANEIANVKAARTFLGTLPNITRFELQPQITRTTDGSKIFYNWADNSNYNLGDANLSPNFMAKAFDVESKKWTAIVDFTSCDAALNGKVFYSHVAAEVMEPSVGAYKIAAVYAIPGVGNDPALPANFAFLDGLVFNDTDFTIDQPISNMVISQGDNWLLCPGASAVFSLSGLADEVLWNDGSTNDSININIDGIYSVVAREGCLMGMDTIVVTGLFTSLSSGVSTICLGDSTYLSVAGNALSYMWTPGGDTNLTVFVHPLDTTDYILTAYGSNCSYDQNILINVNQLPVVTANASDSIVCSGSSVVLFGNGAAVYNWTNGINDGVSFAPVVSDTYTVTGTDLNNCSATASVMVVVADLPDNTVSVNDITITANEVSAGATYQWVDCDNSNSAIAGEINQTFTATINGNYAVVVTLNNCSDTSNCISITSVGLMQNLYESNKISIYPNPNDGRFEIACDIAIKTIVITDAFGNVLRTQQVNLKKVPVNLEEASNGIYFVKIYTEKGIGIKRIAISK